jgi:hypothetical protein
MKKVKIRLDASSLKLSSCLLRLYLTTFKGYRKVPHYNDLIFGSAVHKFIEHYHKLGPDRWAEALALAQNYFQQEPKIIRPRKDYLNDEFLTRACMSYLKALEKNIKLKELKLLYSPKDKTPLVEQKFALPLYDEDDIEILLCGTMDGIYQLGQCAIIGDIKTTAASDIQGYLRGYELSTQFLTYLWALKYLRKNNPDGFFGQKIFENIGCCVIGVFLAGASKDPEVIRSDTFFFSSQIFTEFDSLLESFVTKIVGYFRSDMDKSIGRPPKEGLLNNSCQAAWGEGCPFFGACKAPGEEGFWGVLDAHYTKIEYNPLKFR